MRLAAALIVTAASLASARKTRVYNTTSRRLEGFLNVHLVAHTHDDVGWLKTVDQYYYGGRNNIQHAGVQYILDSVVASLAANPDRKFIYVEQAFFQRWWQQQDAATQALTRQLVASGQLELVNGAWSMHDEANPVYSDMIFNTALGHSYIYEQFGVIPRATWQIDPFGHTSFQASVMASPLTGFSSLFFGRMDYEDFNTRRANQTMEMIWEGSPSLGASASTFTGVLNNLYMYPNGLCWDAVNCNDTPFQDDPTLEDYNVDQIVQLAVQTAQQQAQSYRGGDIMFTMGSDFCWEAAEETFINVDRLIHYGNLQTEQTGVNFLYSTPSMYADAKMGYPDSWPVFSGPDADFMVYADGPHSPWSGYFTSRPALKHYVRESGSYLYAAKQMLTLVGGVDNTDASNPLIPLEHAQAVVQHHDAVAGTAMQHVTDDYALRLAKGRLATDTFVSSALQQLTGDSSNTFLSCDLANVTICPALEAGKAAVLVVYNQLAQPLGNVTGGLGMPFLVRLPVGLPAGVASYIVTDFTGAAVIAQLTPLSPNDLHLRTEYYAYNSSVVQPSQVQWLNFLATAPPMGYATYFLTPSATVEGAPLTHMSELKTVAVHAGATTISNGLLTLTFDTSSGLISGYADSTTGLNAPFSSTFGWYNASVGNAVDGQASGAYIFRPNSSTLFPVTTGAAALQTLSGPVVNEAWQTFDSNWVFQVVRLVSGATQVDFEFTVGPVPFQDGLGREVMAQYSSPMSSGNVWQTTANGRDIMQRQRNYRPAYVINMTEPIAANLFPVNTFLSQADAVSGTTLSIVTDRSQAGGAPVADGALQLMVHRRLQHDDGRGVGEPLNETGLDGNGLIIRGTHRVSLAPAPVAALARRNAAQVHSLFRPAVRIGSLCGTPAQWLAAHKATISGLTAALPNNLHLLSAERVTSNQLLVRLAHVYGANESTTMSTSVSVDLSTLFSFVNITSATEMLLTGTVPLAQAPKVIHRREDGQVLTLPELPEAPAGTALTVTLAPMQIRAWLCNTA